MENVRILVRLLHLDATDSPVSREAMAAGAQVSLTLLVVKDFFGKAVFAHVMPQKGVIRSTTRWIPSSRTSHGWVTPGCR